LAVAVDRHGNSFVTGYFESFAFFDATTELACEPGVELMMDSSWQKPFQIYSRVPGNRPIERLWRREEHHAFKGCWNPDSQTGGAPV
jgi:hypothetical protein